MSVTPSASPHEETPEVTPPKTRSRRQFVVRVIAISIAITALGLCFYALARDWDQVSASLATADLTQVGLASLLASASMVWLAVLWQRCLRVMGTDVEALPVAGWYFVGELGKYLPGGIWQILGRGELAHRRGDVPRRVAYSSTLTAYGFMCLSALMVCAAAGPWWATSRQGDTLAWLLVPLLVLIPIGLHPRLVNVGLSAIRTVARRRIDIEPLPWRSSLSLLAWGVPAWVFLGGSSWMLAIALDVPGASAQIAAAAVAAWIIGFLAIAVPAGAGIRELAFAALSGIDPATAIAIALLARVLLVVVDAAGGLIALTAHGITARRK